MVDRTLKMRYQRVLDSLREDWAIKFVVSGLVWVWVALQNMFVTSAELILLLLVVIIVDYITGNVNARRNNIPIRSLGWRQSIVKVLEYACFLLVLTGVSNVFSNIGGDGWVASLFRATENIDVFGYFFIIMTEVKSIAENLSGKEGTLQRLLREIYKKIFKDNDIDAES